MKNNDHKGFLVHTRKSLHYKTIMHANKKFDKKKQHTFSFVLVDVYNASVMKVSLIASRVRQRNLPSVPVPVWRKEKSGLSSPLAMFNLSRPI